MILKSITMQVPPRTIFVAGLGDFPVILHTDSPVLSRTLLSNLQDVSVQFLPML